MGQNFNFAPSDVIRFMTRNSLREFKKKGSSANIKRLEQYNKEKEHLDPGVVFVSRSKEELAQGKGYVVTSYETLTVQHDSLTHWTPNTFLYGRYTDFKKNYIKGHTKDNLKQVSVIGLDIDTKNIDLYSIFMGCDDKDLPRPNVLLETPKGFQVFFVLDTPFYITNKNEYKSLRVVERISENIKHALTDIVPVDPNCNHFGFFRIPQNGNILYFDDMPLNTSLLISWSKQYEVTEKRKRFSVVFPKVQDLPYSTPTWYSKLANSKKISPGHFCSSRNNTLFTLALENMASGKSMEEAIDELDQFNSNLENGLSRQDFKRVIKSAYSGKYHGPKRSYVENLLELWTDGTSSYNYKTGWYKFKKSREERVRSHYTEWEEDILNFIESSTTGEEPFLFGSLRKLAEAIQVPYSTFKEVLRRSNKIIKKTTGKGRAATTKLTTRSKLFLHLLKVRKSVIAQKNLSFKELLPAMGEVISFDEIPMLDEMIGVILEADIRSRAVDSIRLVI